MIRVDRMNRHHMLMHDRGSGLRFSNETSTCRGAHRAKGMQHFHCHVAIEFVVVALEHNPHSTAAYGIEDLKFTQASQHGRVVGGIEECE